MKLFSQKRKIVNTLLIIVSVSVIVYAHETGVTGKTKKNGEGCTCHSLTPSLNVNVVIDGPDEVAVNETANYSVTITGGPLVRGGTNITVLRGAVNIVSNDLQKIGAELTHTAPKAPSGNSVSFQFTYTAPATAGFDTLYANGNSVNFNGQELGDQWNFAPNKPVNVTSTTSVDDENQLINDYLLFQNYPNPFNPSTTISWNMKESGYISLKIFDAAGREVKTLVEDYRNAGLNSITFHPEELSSGIYYYHIKTGNFSQIKKMLLLK